MREDGRRLLLRHLPQAAERVPLLPAGIRLESGEAVPNLRALNSILAARYGTRQLELLTHADALADRVDRSVIRWWQGLWHRRPPPDYFRLLPVIVRAEVRDGLTRLAYWAHGRTARVLADTVPLAWLQGAWLQRRGNGRLGKAGGVAGVESFGNRVCVLADDDCDAFFFPDGPSGTYVFESRSRILEDESAGPTAPGAIELLLQTLGLTWRDLLGPLREPDTLSTDQARDLFMELLFPPPPEAKVRAWVDRLLATTNFQGDDGRTSPDRLAAVFSQAYSQGKAPAEIARELEPLVDGVKSSARRLARTWGMHTAHSVQAESHAALDDLTIGYQIHSVLDQNTRSSHRLRNGRIFYKDPKPGQPGLDELPHPPMESAKEGHVIAWNCLLPGGVIQGRVQAASKAWYSGEAVEVRTRTGHLLAATVNHPVATENGFVAAGFLQEGDRLVAYVGQDKSFPGSDDKQHAPALIENVFGAFEALGPVTVKRRSPLDFNGDGKFIKGDVEVVRPDWRLRRNAKPFPFQRFNQHAFDRGGIAAQDVSDDRLLFFDFRRNDSADLGLANSSDVLGKLLGRFLQALPANSHRSTFAIGVHAGLFKSPCDSPVRHLEIVGDLLNGVAVLELLDDFRDRQNDSLVKNRSFGGRSHADADFPESVAQRGSLDADFPGQRGNRLPGLVATDQAVQVIDDRADAQFCPFGPGSELDARLREPALHSPVADAEFLAELFQRFPGVVSPDEVVEVRRFHYSGPVYDLQTSTGYFIANTVLGSSGGVLIANCRCWTSPVLSAPSYLKPEDLTLFRDNAGAAVPNPAVYETWFQQAGERQRRLAVGSRRYSELRDQLGREPDYAHFVDPTDGEILSLATLKSEDPKDREERVNKVRRMMADRARDIARVATYGFISPS